MQSGKEHIAGPRSHHQVEKERQSLLHEYHFWMHATDEDIVKSLEQPTPQIFSAMGFKEDFQVFFSNYVKDPAKVLATMREASKGSSHSLRRNIGGKIPDTIPNDEHKLASRPESPQDEEDMDTAHLVHPDDIVFLSQLEPVTTAEVTSKCQVMEANAVDKNMLYRDHQNQVEDINCKSINMYNWMLRAQEQPLYKVVGDSTKFVSTHNWDCVREELLHVRIMERIEELKEKGKWSFLQPRKHRAPPRPKAHWDYLLDEMAWMHADFVEERKLRVSIAKLVSSWVLDYHQASDKSLYTVKAKKRIRPSIASPKQPAAVTQDEQGTQLADEDTTAHMNIDSADDTSDPKAKLTAEAASADGEQAKSDNEHDVVKAETDVVMKSTEPEQAELVPEVNPTPEQEPLEAEKKPDEASADGSGDTKADTEMANKAEEAHEQAVAPEEKALEKGTSHSTTVDENVAPQLYNNVSTAEPNDASSDHTVPTAPELFENALSVYQVLVQLPETEQIEDLIGDSIYTLQSLNTLVPYGPAWDQPYCDILDASPVVPICKTMWPDFGAEDSGDAAYEPSSIENMNNSIDIHELFSLANESPAAQVLQESEATGARSVFTRNLLAPPLLPMFTQANKPPRNSHASGGQPPADTPIQQATGEACPGQAVFEWTAERDRTLAKVVQQYTGNWPLITETFNHASSLYGSRALSPRVCYERWAAIKDDYSLDRTVVQTGYDEPEYGSRRLHNWSNQLRTQPSATPLSAMQLATSFVAHSETFKVVNESKKRRDSAPKPASVPPREIKKLPPGQQVPTPAELSKHKYENDRRIQQLFMEQRQATAAAAALAMQQQRALNPRMQGIPMNRQVAALQAMLASGRALQRPLTPLQTQQLQQQLQQHLQSLQQQQGQGQGQGNLNQRPLQTQQAQQQQQQILGVPQTPQQQQLQLQLQQAVQQAQLNASQAALSQQQTATPAQPQQANSMGSGAAVPPGLRFTPEQVQQLLQARSSNGVRPSIPPALAAVLAARSQLSASGAVRPQGMPRPLNAAAAAAAAASMLNPQQRQMLLQQIAQQQQAQLQQQQQQQQQQSTQQAAQLQGMAPAANAQQAMSPTPLSPQMNTPNMAQLQQQQVAAASTGASGPSIHVAGKSPLINSTSVQMQTSPSLVSDQGTPLMQPSAQTTNAPPASGSVENLAVNANANLAPAQTQALLAAQQAMQLNQQQQQPQLGVNQPQFTQYLSGLFPHQLAQLSTQQRMNLLAMRQLQLQQQQQQQQQQQLPGQLNGQNILNQQAALQALQQNGLNGNNSLGAVNGLAGLNSSVSQQLLAAQIAQNMKNQQLLKLAGQGTDPSSPRPQQPNLTQMQMMRIRQALQQQQQQQQQQPQIQQQQQPLQLNGNARIFQMATSQPASSPVLVQHAGQPVASTPVPASGSPAMSTPLLNGSVGHGFQIPASVPGQVGTSLAASQATMLQTMGVQQPNMSPTAPQQVGLSPQMNVRPPAQRPPQIHTPIQQPPQQQQQQQITSPVPAMQSQQQAMMLAAATAAGLSPAAAQALIAQIAASTEGSQQQQPAAGASSMSPQTTNANLSPKPAVSLPNTSSNTNNAPGRSRAVSSAVNASSTAPVVSMPAQQIGAGISNARSQQQQQQQLNHGGTHHPRPARPVRTGARPPIARPPQPSQANQQSRAGPGTQGGVRPALRQNAQSGATQQRPTGATQGAQQRRPQNPGAGTSPTGSNAGSAKGTPAPSASPSHQASRANTPNLQVPKPGQAKASSSNASGSAAPHAHPVRKAQTPVSAGSVSESPAANDEASDQDHENSATSE